MALNGSVRKIVTWTSIQLSDCLSPSPIYFYKGKRVFPHVKEMCESQEAILRIAEIIQVA
jgi:hypothetical protein